MRTVAVVFFSGFAPLDTYGPIQAFNLSFGVTAGKPSVPDMNDPKYRVISVGLKQTSYSCGPHGMGPATQAMYTFGDLPEVDILLIPGGAGTRRGVHDCDLIDGIRRVGERTPIVASVCTGAALLAKTGLLDGKSATTNKTAWKWVIEQGPNVHWTCPPRWVDCVDAKSQRGHITSGGVSAGTDMALGLIQKLDGEQVVRNTTVLMEYDWTADPASDHFRYLCPDNCSEFPH